MQFWQIEILSSIYLSENAEDLVKLSSEARELQKMGFKRVVGAQYQVDICGCDTSPRSPTSFRRGSKSLRVRSPYRVISKANGGNVTSTSSPKLAVTINFSSQPPTKQVYK